MGDGISISHLKNGAKRSHGYFVAPFPDQGVARKIVNKRRGASLSVPGLRWKAQIKAQTAMFERFRSYGLAPYENCTTAEMYSRPVPHVFPEKETDAVTALFNKWAPRLYHRLMSELKPPVATLNKVSRLGFPLFNRPESKKAALKPWFDRALSGNMDEFREAFIVMNVRLQPEPVTKEREFLFCSGSGEIYPKKVGKEQRRFTSKAAGERIAARTRLVFNLPILNLLTQVLDSALLNALLAYPVCHHNMYDPAMTRFSGSTLFFDVKHMERATARCVRARAEILGGIYADISRLFATLPFLVPSDDWENFFLLWVDRLSGMSDQFASGYSPVSGSQKELFVIIYASFACEYLHMAPDEALTWVLGGGDNCLRILNSGDDNALGGDEGLLRDLFDYIKAFLHVEKEEPPKFLGFLYTPEGWRLGALSYILKTYLNERSPGVTGRRATFRKFPFWGWTLKRDLYRQHGIRAIAEEVFPYEDYVLKSVGLPWSRVVEEAGVEKTRASADAIWTNPMIIMGKDWKLTAEEKLATGMFEGFTPEETAPMVRSLLGKEWKGKSSWI